MAQVNCSVSNDSANVFFFISTCNESACVGTGNKTACICKCHLPQINVDNIVCMTRNYKLYFAMAAANNKTHTVKGKEKKRKKKTHNIQ